jgi:superfamily II DNA or RNA helicase
MDTIGVRGDQAFVTFEKPYPQDEFKQQMSFRVKGYRFIPAVKNGMWDGYVSMLKRHTIPTGLYRAIKPELERDHGIEFAESILWNEPPDWKRTWTSDRAWQNECAAAMIESMPTGGGTIIAATSAGKTAMAALFYSMVEGRHLFVVDQVKLLYQAQADISEYLKEPVGIIGNSEFAPGRVTVATIQTLRSWSKQAKFMAYAGGKLETTIVDEVHTQLASSNFDVVTALRPKARFGLTATLQMDEREVWLKVSSFSGPVIYTYNIVRGIAEGILAHSQYHQIRFAPEVSPSQIKVNRDAIKIATEHSGIAPERLDAWQENVLNHREKARALRWLVRGFLSRNRYIVILADKHAHIDQITRVLHEFDPMVITGKIKRTAADESIEAFEQGKNRLIIASRVFNKGISIKRIDTIINVGEIEDANTIVQQIGRELRLHDDKNGAIFVDLGTATGRYRETAQNRLDSVKAAGIPTTLWNWERQRSDIFAALKPPTT